MTRMVNEHSNDKQKEVEVLKSLSSNHRGKGHSHQAMAHEPACHVFVYNQQAKCISLLRTVA